MKGEFGRALHIKFEIVYTIADFQLISSWNKPTITLWKTIENKWNENLQQLIEFFFDIIN